jgi:hypothetical protein
MTTDGDIAVTSGGDIALCDSHWRDYSQQAYIILMTATSDYALYPSLGADLEELVGMPQSKETGDYGIALIRQAFTRNGKFSGIPIDIKAVPVSLQGIRFDIYITAGSRTEMILSIEQNLGIS